MDQMFKHDPLIDNEGSDLKEHDSKKIKKNTKLTQWFIKK